MCKLNGKSVWRSHEISAPTTEAPSANGRPPLAPRSRPRVAVPACGAIGAFLYLRRQLGRGTVCNQAVLMETLTGERGTMIYAGAGLSTQRETSAAARQASEMAMEQAHLKCADAVVLFVTMHHSDRYGELLNVVAQTSGRRKIVGCSGMGILGLGQEVETEPAIAVLVLSCGNIEWQTCLVSKLRAPVNRRTPPPATLSLRCRIPSIAIPQRCWRACSRRALKCLCLGVDPQRGIVALSAHVLPGQSLAFMTLSQVSHEKTWREC